MAKKVLSAAERIAQASATNRGGVHFLDGKYDARVEKIVYDESSQGKGEYIAFEFELLASDNEKLKRGTVVSQVYMFHHGDVTFSNLKMACLAILGMTEEQFDEELSPEEQGAMIEHMYAGDGTNAAGATVRAQANTIKKRNGDDFTKVVYSPLDEAEIGTAGEF